MNKFNDKEGKPTSALSIVQRKLKSLSASLSENETDCVVLYRKY